MEHAKITGLLKDRLYIEERRQDRSGVYALTQRKLAYNSNRIEGSTLTEKQTASIFETGTIQGDGSVFRTKDVEEMTGHFTMFNYMLSTCEERLSQELIKAYHYRLKAGVFEDIANGYPMIWLSSTLYLSKSTPFRTVTAARGGLYCSRSV